MKNLINLSPFNNTIFGAVCLALALLSLSACGNDPLQVIGTTEKPVLNGIIAGNISTTPGGFSANNPYWSFTGLGSGVYLAPATGVVADVSTSTVTGVAASTVTILHGGRLATRLYGLQTVNVRSNDIVQGGQAIGVFFSSGSVYFQVLFNGVADCPLYYMSAQFRAQFTGGYPSSSLCL